MPEKPIMHGRDHRPGGIDPIPGIAGLTLAAAYCWNIHGATLSVPGTTTGGKIPWAHFQTTDTSIFGTDTSTTATAPYHNTAGDTYVICQDIGFYLAAGQCHWASGATNVDGIVDNNGSQWVINVVGGAFSADEAPSGTGTLVCTSYRLFYVDSTAGPMATAFTVDNNDSSTHTVNTATLGVFYLGTSPDLTQIY